MKSEKTPELLVVVIRTKQQQWFVAGVDLQGDTTAMVCSEPGNLAEYVGQPEDEQLSFLRHRLSGAMQRGCNRLWARKSKAMLIVVIADDHLTDSDPSLLSNLAEHLHTWMTRPPVVCYRANERSCIGDLSSLQCLIGDVEPEQLNALEKGLPQISQLLADPDCWEVVQKPKA
jgi:hypothetical protein